MGAMLSSPLAVSGVFLVPACGSCIVKPCIFAYAIWSLRLLNFFLSRLSVLIFILYCYIVYVLIEKDSNKNHTLNNKSCTQLVTGDN